MYSARNATPTASISPTSAASSVLSSTRGLDGCVGGTALSTTVSRLLTAAGAEPEQGGVGLAKLHQLGLERPELGVLVGVSGLEPGQALDLGLRVRDLLLGGLEVGVHGVTDLLVLAGDGRSLRDELVRNGGRDGRRLDRVRIGHGDREQRAVGRRVRADDLPSSSVVVSRPTLSITAESTVPVVARSAYVCDSRWLASSWL